MRQVLQSMVALASLALSAGCGDDPCDVGRSSLDGKISQNLAEQLQEEPDGDIAVGIVGRNAEAMSCITAAVEEAGGRVDDRLGSVSLLAVVPAPETEHLARRRDIVNISADIDDTPPP
jgi:hypothetical protein